jgi:hypothetical protein
MIGGGLIWLHRGNFNYQNYWGGVVFAPLPIAVGLLILLAAIFRWKKLVGPRMDKKGRPIKSPFDDNSPNLP